MNLDSTSLEKQRSIRTISQQAVDNLIKSMEKYGHLMYLLHDIYTHQVTSFLHTMDTYYTCEQASFSQNKIQAEQGQITQQDINNKLQSIQKALDDFEEEFQAIKKSLRTIIDQFEDKQDRKEETLKSNKLHELFLAIYNDIDDLRMDYQRLSRKTSKK